jgi:type IV secretion system protein VirD4
MKKKPVTWNVLDSIDPADPESLDKIRALAEAIVKKLPNEHDPHWSERSENFIAGGIATVMYCCEPHQRNLQDVATILSNRTALQMAKEELCKCKAHNGLVARMGYEMDLSVDKELAGILSTVSRSLAFLNSPAVMESTKGTEGLDLSALYKGRGATIYCVLPLQYVNSHAGLMRLWITGIMQYVVSRGINHHPVNMILDECAATLDGNGKTLENMLAVGTLLAHPHRCTE